jgi:hypothetical protein
VKKIEGKNMEGKKVDGKKMEACTELLLLIIRGVRLL